MAQTITTQVTLYKEMVLGSRLSMVVTLEGLINIPIPCFDIFEGTLLGSWCQQDFSEIITVTIFVQWIRCGRVTWDGGGDWHLWGELTRRPSLQLALGTRFIIRPWLFLKPWFLLSQYFFFKFWVSIDHLDEKEFTGVESLWWSPSRIFQISSYLSSRFLSVYPFLKVFLRTLFTMMMAIQVFLW